MRTCSGYLARSLLFGIEGFFFERGNCLWTGAHMLAAYRRCLTKVLIMQDVCASINNGVEVVDTMALLLM
jgi:hypothetical protein